MFMLTVNRTEPVNQLTIPMVHGGMVYKIANENPAALALKSIDRAEITLVHTLKKGEREIRGTERIIRLATKKLIPLDIKFLAVMLSNCHIIPRPWRRKRKDCYPTIFFDGTIIADQDNREYILGMTPDYMKSLEWNLVRVPIEYSRLSCDLSAVVKTG